VQKTDGSSGDNKGTQFRCHNLLLKRANIHCQSLRIKITNLCYQIKKNNRKLLRTSEKQFISGKIYVDTLC